MDEAPREEPEQDVLVIVPLGNRSMGTAAERLEIEELGEELGRAVREAGAGEYDGEEFGGGECTLFFAGPDAAKVVGLLVPLLRKHRRGRGARVVAQADGGAPTELRL